MVEIDVGRRGEVYLDVASIQVSMRKRGGKGEEVESGKEVKKDD